MKKLLFLMVLVLLVACNRDNEVQENVVMKIATVENPSTSSNFYLRLDDNKRLWTAQSDLKYYRPVDGQRVIATYVVLTNKADSSNYQHDVKLKDVYEILTKGIFNIKPDEQDSIGNDPLTLMDLWIGGDHLNIEFNYPGYSKIHYINLVADSAKTYTDNKIHLELRHNANGDYPGYNIWGMASFDLKPLKLNAAGDSVNLVIHTREYRSPQNISYSLTYKFNPTAPSAVRRSIIPKQGLKPR